jgi:hypothetical protein
VRNNGEKNRFLALGMPRCNLLVDSDLDLQAAIKALTNGLGSDIVLRTTGQETTSCILSEYIASFGALVDEHPADEKTPQTI